MKALRIINLTYLAFVVVAMMIMPSLRGGGVFSTVVMGITVTVVVGILGWRPLVLVNGFGGFVGLFTFVLVSVLHLLTESLVGIGLTMTLTLLAGLSGWHAWRVMDEGPVRLGS